MVRGMTEGIRNGLGVLCVAAMALVVALATAGGSEPLVSSGAMLIAGVLTLLGLASIAMGLFRR